MTMSILELLQHIVNEPAPKLTPEGRFPKEAEDFVNSCLLKEPDHRRTPKDLLVGDLLHVCQETEPLNLGRVLVLFLAESRVDRTRAISTL
jgi:serine/threonine protein kinase